MPLGKYLLILPTDLGSATPRAAWKRLPGRTERWGFPEAIRDEPAELSALHILHLTKRTHLQSTSSDGKMVTAAESLGSCWGGEGRRQGRRGKGSSTRCLLFRSMVIGSDDARTTASPGPLQQQAGSTGIHEPGRLGSAMGRRTPRSMASVAHIFCPPCDGGPDTRIRRYAPMIRPISDLKGER